MGPVAQLDRASDYGSEGWGFESLRARTYKYQYQYQYQVAVTVTH